MEIIDRCFDPPEQSYFLFGPRGTGKSTWLRRQYPDALLIDLLSPEEERLLGAQPERLRGRVKAYAEGQAAGAIIVIDEIQKVPSLLSVVHQLLEEGRRYQFVLTGSSSRKIKRAGVDLLAGRALLRTFHPFLAVELGPRFHLEEVLFLGLLPVVLGAKHPEETLRTYVSLTLKEEVKAEGLVRNLGAFSRVLEVLSFSHGSLLNMSAVARESAVERKTVEGYLEIIEDVFLGERLPVFSKRAQRALTSHPKFYFFDAGVYRSLRPRGPLDAPAEIGGAALEGLVFQHLRSWIACGNREEQLSFWRTRAGAEVDFVLDGPEGLFAIEVTSSRTVGPGNVSALRSFREDYPHAQALLLYGGDRRTLERDVLCLPHEVFLQQLHPARGLHEVMGSLPA